MKKIQNVQLSKPNIKRLIATISFLMLFSFCNQSNQVDQSKADQNLLVGLLAGQAQEANKDFTLNGQWDSFTGNGTTKDTIQTFNAKAGVVGIYLTDATTYSSCGLIHSFDNNSGYYINQNPPNNGICPNGFTDASKGKYFKTVFFKNTAKSNSYWTCTINSTGKNTLEEALALPDTSVRTNPGSSGCAGFSWSRIEKR